MSAKPQMPKMPKPCDLVNTKKPPKPEAVEYLKKNNAVKGLTKASAKRGFNTMPDGKYLYLVAGKNPETIRFVDAKLEKEQGVKHPSLAEAIGTRDVLMAGEIVRNGNTFKINNSSGHYKPAPNCNKYLLWLMKNHYGLTLKKASKRELKDRVKEEFIYEIPSPSATSGAGSASASKRGVKPE